MEALRQKLEVARTMAAAEVETAKNEAEIMLRNVKLKTENEMQLLRLKGEEERQKGQQNIKMLEFQQKMQEQDNKQKADAATTIAAAKAQADATLQKAQAEAAARLCLAEADARAADLLGASYSKNSEFVRFKLAEIQTEISKARAAAMSTAMSSNKGAMMEPDLQRELAVLDAGFSPVAPVVLGGVVGGSGRKPA